MEELIEQFEGLSIPERLALYQPLYPEAVLLKKGNRQVCSNSHKGRKEYANRREFLIAVYDGICFLCGQRANSPTLEHPAGRGMDAAHRDDSITVMKIACWGCNARKGSRRVVEGSCPFCEYAVVIGGRVDRECLRCNLKWTEGQ